jgi:NAD(P)-dependent dehydrogenase (short-subunit alcohol dehydrogenase family)
MAWSTTPPSARWAPCSPTDEAVFEKIFDVNVKGTYLMSRAVIPHMAKAGGGAIVNIGSGAGYGKAQHGRLRVQQGRHRRFKHGHGL